MGMLMSWLEILPMWTWTCTFPISYQLKCGLCHETWWYLFSVPFNQSFKRMTCVSIWGWNCHTVLAGVKKIALVCIFATMYFLSGFFRFKITFILFQVTLHGAKEALSYCPNSEWTAFSVFLFKFLSIHGSLSIKIPDSSPLAHQNVCIAQCMLDKSLLNNWLSPREASK